MVTKTTVISYRIPKEKIIQYTNNQLGGSIPVAVSSITDREWIGSPDYTYTIMIPPVVTPTTYTQFSYIFTRTEIATALSSYTGTTINAGSISSVNDDDDSSYIKIDVISDK